MILCQIFGSSTQAAHLIAVSLGLVIANGDYAEPANRPSVGLGEVTPSGIRVGNEAFVNRRAAAARQVKQAGVAFANIDAACNSLSLHASTVTDGVNVDVEQRQYSPQVIYKTAASIGLAIGDGLGVGVDFAGQMRLDRSDEATLF